MSALLSPSIAAQMALEDFLTDAVLVSTYNNNMYLFRGMEYNMNPTMIMPWAEVPSQAESADGHKRKRSDVPILQSFLDYYR